MTSLLPTIKDSTITIETTGVAPVAVVAFTGVLGHRDPGILLDPFFNELHDVMKRQHLSSVRLDLRALRFMNSSSFKSFIAFVKRNGALPPAQRVRIHFVLNEKFHWQEVSIHALRCFSVDEIAVEKVKIDG